MSAQLIKDIASFSTVLIFIFIYKNTAFLFPVSFVNRKEGNVQESIQLPSTFRSKTTEGEGDALKVTAPESKHYMQKDKKDSFFPKNSQTAINK